MIFLSRFSVPPAYRFCPARRKFAACELSLLVQ
nr:MAG TPA: hypothetical protein [Caudoviricetes sp.]